MKHASAYLARPAGMLELLEGWRDRGWLRDLDVALARLFAELEADGAAPPLALLATALLSEQAGRGHLLLDLRAALAAPEALLSSAAGDLVEADLPGPAAVLAGIDLQTWQALLAAWPRVGDGSTATPLVLRGHDLYLHRFWVLEQTITAQVERRVAAPIDLDPVQLRGLLDPLFPPASRPADGSVHWQRIACAVAARARFAVITGGPGTGKTTTVIKLLALLQAQALATGGALATGEAHAAAGALAAAGVQAPRALRVRLAAPTGKAAARLDESIAAQVAQLDLAHLGDPEGVRAAIPTEVATLHRLLGARPDTRQFRFDAERPLPVDLVVVDEASLIDVDLMAALFEALPRQARLILIGDKDQLASVEAGAVLGALCARADVAGYAEDTRAWLQAATGESLDEHVVSATPRPLDQCISALRHSYRFGVDSGIGRFARAVNAGDTAAAVELLRGGAYADLQLFEGAAARADALSEVAIVGVARAAGHLHWLAAIEATRPDAAAGPEGYDAWAAELLRLRAGFQLLTPLQRGPWGVASLNALIEAELLARGHIHRPAPGAAAAGAAGPGGATWYEGRPVLVTANDYNLQLMNGDMGIALRVPPRGQGAGAATPSAAPGLRVAFARGDDPSRIRWVLPSRLPRCQTVYALTVHKSQGSEFDHAALVLPDRGSPVLTRELVYTAATRARRHFTLFAPQVAVLEQAVRQRTQRASRLFES